MTRFVLATSILAASALSASAADLPARSLKAPPPAAPAYSWSGCYVGIEAGWGSGRSGIEAVTVLGNGPPAAPGLPFTNDFNLNGSLAGGTAGRNYQTGNWVFGIEGDISWTDQNGSANNIFPFNQADTNHLREKWFDTVRGRIGYALDRVLVYGTAGAALAGTTLQFFDNRIPGGSVSDSQTRSGWVAGGGVEYAFLGNLSLKAEYMHADFGARNYFDPPVVDIVTVNTRKTSLTDDIARVGLNYRFGWGGPVVAK
jgi:outer membrane immunogenic protein